MSHTHCQTARFAEFTGLTNGQLLDAAGFEVLLTAGQGIPEQQNMVGRRISVLTLCAPTNRLRDLEAIVPAALSALQAIQPGAIVANSAGRTASTPLRWAAGTCPGRAPRTSGTFSHENRETSFGVCRETDRPVGEGNCRTAHAHAGEGSDNAIVLMKQPNKDGRPLAEAVEGSALTEENTGRFVPV